MNDNYIVSFLLLLPLTAAGAFVIRRQLDNQWLRSHPKLGFWLIVVGLYATLMIMFFIAFSNAMN